MPTTLRAQNSCSDIVTKCDKALEEAHKTLDLYADALRGCKGIVTNLNLDIVDRDKELASIWRNPWFVGALGVVAGGVLVLRLK